MKTIYPNKLNKGDTIGITATSSESNFEKLDKAIENIKSLGYVIVETSNVRSIGSKCVSSDEKTRAEEFIQLWKNPNVKHIIESRGGEFLMETIPYIHEAFQKEKLYENPTWLQGYSDITTLLFYLTTWYNIATIESSNLGNYAMTPLHESLLKPLDIQSNEIFVQENYPCWEIEEKEDNNFQFNLTAPSKVKSMSGKDEEFSGVLIGGCLDVISLYTGTKWDNVNNYIEDHKEEGIIWHLENCELTAADIYRKLWFMGQQGWFKYVKGFIVGRTWCEQSTVDFTYLDAIEKGLGKYGVPIIYDLDIGHTAPQWTIINGAYAHVKYANGKCILEQNMK